MIKLIASDLDDTLLDSELRISQENKDAVRDALAQGMVFTIATGRMFQSAAPYAVELGLDEQQPLICYNGALIKGCPAKHCMSVFYPPMFLLPWWSTVCSRAGL